MIQTSQLNISLDIMMIMLLEHYVQSCLKCLDMLNALKIKIIMMIIRIKKHSFKVTDIKLFKR